MVTKNFLLVYYSIFHSPNRFCVCVCVCVCVKFYLGQNEECSMGGSISDRSQILLQRGNGRKVNKILVKADHSPNSQFEKYQVFIFITSCLSVCFFMDFAFALAFWCLTQGHRDFPLYFLLKMLQFCVLHVDL